MPEQAAIIDMNTLYWVVGAFVVMNLGTMVTVLVAAGKAIWWASSVETRLNRNKESLDKAHQAVRRLRDI